MLFGGILMELKEKIEALKKQQDAVILAHYYVSDEVQAIADYIGDSFYLSKLAVSLNAKTLVVCGVSFMGESAKILNPEKKVLLPDSRADCAMAHMITPEKVAQLRAEHPAAAVVCYINSTAELKTCSDVCVTSANALSIVRALPNQEIIFIPDENLGRHIAARLPEKQFIFNDGRCPIHAKITPEDIERAKAAHPGAPVLAHPECTPAVLAKADYIGSTSGILQYATDHADTQYIIATECGIGYKLRTQNPTKEFFFVEPLPVCEDMKFITLEKIAHVLETGEGEVTLEEVMRRQANAPLERMLALAK